MLLEAMMSESVWRINYKNVDWKEWKPINRLYKTRGIATGVLKRGNAVIWDDVKKVWHTLEGQLIFKIQSADLEWIDYGWK